MPDWKPEVLDAFRTLNIDIDVATQADAAKAYKTQAIRHHPDKNPGDPAATQRFQKLGAAWDICQTHFEDPSRSYVTAMYDDDGGGIDPDDLAFFMFMFEEVILGNFAGRRQYRSRRGRGGGQQGPQAFFTPFGGGFAFGVSPSYYSSGYSGSGGGYSGSRQLKQEDEYANEQNQAKKKTAYEKRLREFELEIEAEKRELQRQAIEKSKDENKRAAAYQQAFQAARAGKASTVISLVEEYGLDVNSPEKMARAASKKSTNFQTLLHAACRSCDEGLILFLLDKGAIPDALNDAKLYPFHVAIACGNVAAVKFFLLRRVRGRETPGCNPSKVAPDGRTPLQIAIVGGNAEMVALMTKEATVHDVERCWPLPDAAPFKVTLLEKKGFTDPETRELRRLEEERKLAEERAREEQKAADERARLADKARLKEERQKRAAEQLARKQELEAIEEQKRRDEAELARQKKEAEERKAELEARQEMAEAAKRKAEQEAAEARLRAQQDAEEARRKAQREAEAARRKAEREAAEAQRAEQARRKAEHEARVQAEAEAVRQAAEARVRAEAQARQLAEEQERARRQAEEESRLKKAAKAEAKRIQREAEAVTVRQEAEAEARRQAAVQAEALRIAAAEKERLQQIAAQEAERNMRAALAQQRLEAKRAESLRRLQGQAEEHRRQAEAKIQAAELERSAKLQTQESRPTKLEIEDPTQHSTQPPMEDAARAPSEQRRKVPKKHLNRDLSQISPEELQKRAAQSARDKVRIAEEKRLKAGLSARTRPDTPENMQGGRRHHGEDYIPPTPVSMPSPSQRRLSPPLVPHHTRPNVPARTMDSFGQLMLAPEDIQTAAMPDDLFAIERPVVVPVAAKESVPEPFRDGPAAFRGRGRGGYYRGRGRGRGRHGVE